MLAQLLRNLPGFFNRNPQAEPVLRVRHAAGLYWTINDADTLTLTVPEQPDLRLDLRWFTVAELADHLRDSGFVVPWQNPDFAERRASVLLPGTGDQDRSNGDHLYGFRSILWAHLKAIAAELTDADAALAALLRQLILPEARERWADFWGTYFGLARRSGELDATYTQRILAEFYRARNNPVAMRRNVERDVGADITLFEPWRRMMTLSRDPLSGTAHLPGRYYQYHILHPFVRSAPDWAAVRAVLNADRPAGTLLWSLQYQPGPRVLEIGADLTLHHARTRVRPRRLTLYRDPRLSVDLMLSAEARQRQERLQFLCARARVNRRTATATLFAANASIWSGTWGHRSWIEPLATVGSVHQTLP